MSREGNGLPSISNSNLQEETVTFVVTVDNEGGEMVVDITTAQLLDSSVAERNRIMTVDDHTSSNAPLLNIPSNNYCEAKNISSSSYPLHTSPQVEELFSSNSVPEITYEPETNCTTLNNEDIVQDQIVTIESTSVADTTQISYLTPVHIPNGPVLFVLESSTPGGPSQVVAMSTKPAADLTKKKIKSHHLSILPKPSASSSPPALTDSRQDSLTTKKSPKRRKKTAGNKKQMTEKNADYLEVCILPSTSVISTPGSAATKTFICELCTDEPVHNFPKFVDLARHYLRVHQLRLLKQASAQCREQDCSFKSWRAHDLRNHLSAAHNFTMDLQTLEFMSMKEFEEWKADEEVRSSSKFIRSSGNHPGSCRTQNQANQATVYVYYACQRSGNLRARNSSVEPSRKSNRITSLKIDGLCTASISLIHDKQLNRVSCDYCSTHYGHHVNSSTRQNLSKQEKESIHQLLLRGWTSDEIVKTLRNGIISGTTDRMQKVVRQDVFNVGRSYGVRNLERKHADDDQSVKLWVEELKKTSCVVVWHPNNHTLLVVMSRDQVELIRQHGQVLHVAAFKIDLDRCYHLLTLAALSSNGSKAYLVAYALSDTPSLIQAYQELFSAVQSKLDNFSSELKILCDDPLLLEEACLSDIVGSSTFLIPPWKVENDWNTGLLKYINDETKRGAVKKCIDTLLNERNPTQFAAFMELFNGMLAADGSLLSFSRFFFTSYSTLAAHWAGFHSLPNCISLHKLVGELELVARRSRSTKRLDKAIYSLQYIAANQPFQPLTTFLDAFGGNEAAEESSNLHQSISTQLKVLETAVPLCNLETLKTIKRIVSKAADISTNQKM